MAYYHNCDQKYNSVPVWQTSPLPSWYNCCDCPEYLIVRRKRCRSAHCLTSCAVPCFPVCPPYPCPPKQCVIISPPACSPCPPPPCPPPPCPPPPCPPPPCPPPPCPPPPCPPDICVPPTYITPTYIKPAYAAAVSNCPLPSPTLPPAPSACPTLPEYCPPDPACLKPVLCCFNRELTVKIAACDICCPGLGQATILNSHCILDNCGTCLCLNIEVSIPYTNSAGQMLTLEQTVKIKCCDFPAQMYYQGAQTDICGPVVTEKRSGGLVLRIPIKVCY